MEEKKEYVDGLKLLDYIQELKDIYFLHPDISLNLCRISRFVLDNLEEVKK